MGTECWAPRVVALVVVGALIGVVLALVGALRVAGRASRNEEGGPW